MGQNYQDKLTQVKALYMKNINSFQKSIFGLEEADPFKIEPEFYEQELK